jgi:hypothetical protein
MRLLDSSIYPAQGSLLGELSKMITESEPLSSDLYYYIVFVVLIGSGLVMDSIERG